nr:MAG TPA: hypothetical protein [Caudoviricetes sp.]
MSNTIRIKFHVRYILLSGVLGAASPVIRLYEIWKKM